MSSANTTPTTTPAAGNAADVSSERGKRGENVGKNVANTITHPSSTKTETTRTTSATKKPATSSAKDTTKKSDASSAFDEIKKNITSSASTPTVKATTTSAAASQSAAQLQSPSINSNNHNSKLSTIVEEYTYGGALPSLGTGSGSGPSSSLLSRKVNFSANLSKTKLSTNSKILTTKSKAILNPHPKSQISRISLHRPKKTSNNTLTSSKSVLKAKSATTTRSSASTKSSTTLTKTKLKSKGKGKGKKKNKKAAADETTGECSANNALHSLATAHSTLESLLPPTFNSTSGDESQAAAEISALKATAVSTVIPTERVLSANKAAPSSHSYSLPPARSIAAESKKLPPIRRFSPIITTSQFYNCTCLKNIYSEKSKESCTVDNRFCSTCPRQMDAQGNDGDDEQPSSSNNRSNSPTRKRKINEEAKSNSEAAAAAGPSTSTQPADDDDKDKEEDKDGKKKKNRCAECRKKVGLTGFQCRCGGLYCAVHRYSDKHDCTFNYREHGAQEIRRNNPVVVGEKIQKI